MCLCACSDTVVKTKYGVLRGQKHAVQSLLLILTKHFFCCCLFRGFQRRCSVVQGCSLCESSAGQPALGCSAVSLGLERHSNCHCVWLRLFAVGKLHQHGHQSQRRLSLSQHLDSQENLQATAHHDVLLWRQLVVGRDELCPVRRRAHLAKARKRHCRDGQLPPGSARIFGRTRPFWKFWAFGPASGDEVGNGSFVTSPFFIFYLFFLKKKKNKQTNKRFTKTLPLSEEIQLSLRFGEKALVVEVFPITWFFQTAGHTFNVQSLSLDPQRMFLFCVVGFLLKYLRKCLGGKTDERDAGCL